MDIQAFREAIDIAGGQVALAQLMGESRQSVISNWLSRGSWPAAKTLKISEAVNWKVTPHRLAPELYPHPDDGLPLALRRPVETGDAA